MARREAAVKYAVPPFPEDFLRHVDHNKRRASQREREAVVKAAKEKG